MKNFGLKEAVDAVFKIGLIAALFTFLFFQNQRFEQSKDKGRYHQINDDEHNGVFDSTTGKSYYLFKHEKADEHDRVATYDPISAKIQLTDVRRGSPKIEPVNIQPAKEKPDYSKMSDEELAKRAGVKLPPNKPLGPIKNLGPIKPEESEASKEKPDYSKISDLELVKLAEQRGIITKEEAKKARDRINAPK